MVIIEEINKIADKRKEIAKIKELFDIRLPIKYRLEETEDSLSIVEGKIFKGTVAYLKLDKDIIEVSFVCEEDLEKLRKYFEDSDTKFKLIVGDNYY